MLESSDVYKRLIRYAVCLTAFAACVIFVFWRISEALLLIFAGVLFAAFLDALTRLLGHVRPRARGICLAIVCLTLAITLMAALAWGGTALAMQGSNLPEILREQINTVLNWPSQRGIKIIPDHFDDLTDQALKHSQGRSATLQSVLPDVGGLFGAAWTAISVVLGVLGDALVIIFLGLFLATKPAIYRDAILLLAPVSDHRRYRGLLDESGDTLQHWLLGQSLTMSVIAVFVWLELTLVGVGSAFLLGLQAACSHLSRHSVHCSLASPSCSLSLRSDSGV